MSPPSLSFPPSPRPRRPLSLVTSILRQCALPPPLPLLLVCAQGQAVAALVRPAKELSLRIMMLGRADAAHTFSYQLALGVLARGHEVARLPCQGARRRRLRLRRPMAKRRCHCCRAYVLRGRMRRCFRCRRRRRSVRGGGGASFLCALLIRCAAAAAAFCVLFRSGGEVDARGGPRSSSMSGWDAAVAAGTTMVAQ